MKIIRTLSVVAMTLLWVPTTALAGDLETELSDIFSAAVFEPVHWGVRVEKLDGTEVFDLNGQKNFMPASNLKLYTTAAVLDNLGSDYVYTTRVDVTGEIAEDGTLKGDVVIVGSGDPMLGAWHPDKDRNSAQLFAGWIGDLREAGIQSIDGDIIGDGRYFTEEYINLDWSAWDLPYWYAAGSSGLVMEENAFRIRIMPGEAVGDLARLEITPQTDYVTLINKVRTVEKGGTSNADASWRGDDNSFIYDRTIALDKEVINERGSVLDGARYAAFLFREALEREGITVSGEALNIRQLPDPARIDEAPSRKTLIEHRSIPMSEIATLTNDISHNLYADQILRTLAAEQGRDADFKGGTAAVKEWLEKIGAPGVEEIDLVDGSGLASGNVIQPRQMTYLLRWMKNESKEGEAFEASLSVSGVSGWIRNRLNGPMTKGHVRAKTGTINKVRSLSGYVDDADGQTYVFSMICNQHNFGSKKVDAAIDAALTAVASQGSE